MKPLGGYRDYPTEVVKQARFIKRAQGLGFSLEDVAGLLQPMTQAHAQKTVP